MLVAVLPLEASLLSSRGLLRAEAGDAQVLILTLPAPLPIRAAVVMPVTGSASIMHVSTMYQHQYLSCLTTLVTHVACLNGGQPLTC